MLALEEFLGLVILFAMLTAIIVVPGAVVVGLRNRRENRRAADMANRLGLQLIDRKPDMVRGSGAKPLMRLLFPFVPWAMRGIYNGVQVSIERFGGGPTEHPSGAVTPEGLQPKKIDLDPLQVLNGTAYRAWFEKPLPVQMEVRSVDPISDKLVDPEKTVPSGDEDLDQRCRIFGRNRKEIADWLADADRRAALAELFRSLDQAYVHSEGVSVETEKRAPDCDEAQSTLDCFTRFVRAWSAS